MIVHSGVPLLPRVGLNLGLAMCLLTVPVLAQRPSSSAPDAATVARSAGELSGEPSLSPPMLSMADIDSTTAPCHDFHQYAAGRWSERPLPPVWDRHHHIARYRAGKALQQFLELAPALAPTTKDVATRVLGTFYGSCLADTVGTAEGAVGDTTRARYCFQETRRYLDPALFTVLLTRVWPPAAQAESRQLWEHTKAAAEARVRASAALDDRTRQRLLQDIAVTTLELKAGTDTRQQLPFLPLLDSLAAPRVSPGYAGLVLSPTDFAQNLARMRGQADTLSPFRQGIVVPLLDAIFPAANPPANFASGGGKQVTMPVSPFMPPVVAGTMDVGGWYGLTGALLGHEMTHNFDIYLGSLREFTREQLREQFGPWLELQAFQNQIGILLAYAAFERAMHERPRRRIEGFTPEQRFFIGVAQYIGFAQGWRGEQVWGWRMAVNGTLSVMPAFARAFGCKAGGPMTGGRIWYRDPRPPRSVPRPSGEMAEREWQHTVDWMTAEWFWAAVDDRFQGASEALVKLRAKHKAERQALTDSLGLTTPGEIPLARWQRTSSLFVRQLGEARPLLPAAQHAMFDAVVRNWLRQYTEPSWKVAVPWLVP